MLGSGACDVSMAGVHRVASLAALGAGNSRVMALYSQTAISMNSCSRFNRRIQLMLFYRLLQQAVEFVPVTYGDVVSKNTVEPIGYHCWMKSQYQQGCWS